MNIQQTILTAIRESLYRHDYLVLPGFGGFVLKRLDTHFVSSGGALHPPSRTLSFNAQLRQDDGILVSWLVKSLKCKPQEAAAHLSSFTSYCKTVLEAKRRIALPGVGLFFLDFESNVCFEPQADINFERESFGLSAVVLNLVAGTTTEKRAAAFVDRTLSTSTADRKKRTFSSRAYLAATSAAAALFALLVLIISYSRTGGVMKASIFGTGAAPAYSPIDYLPLDANVSAPLTSSYVIDASGHASIDFGGKIFIVKLSTSPAARKEMRVPLPGLHRGGYEVVLGCFSKPRNARRLVADLAKDGIRAAISGTNTNGLIVVSAGSFRSHAEAINRLDELKRVVPGAWVRSHRAR